MTYVKADVRGGFYPPDQFPGCSACAMSGSGPVWFALFRNRAAAKRARTALATVAPGWWCDAVCVNHSKLDRSGDYTKDQVAYKRETQV